MKILGYARISVDAVESQSIDQQHHLVGRWAEYKHPGVELAWFDDLGVSGGKELAKRPAGMRLLRQVRKGDVVAVTKIDRLARSAFDLLGIVKRLNAIGARLVVSEQDIDTGTSGGKLLLTVLGALAEAERDAVSERVKGARAQFLRDGRHGVGKLPFGFQAVPHPERGFLVVRPHPEEGPALRQAIGNILAGKSVASQARELGQKAVAFQRLMKSPRLYGQTPGGGLLDPEAGVITAAMFQQLQRRLGGPHNWSRTDGCGDALKCYACGARMYLDTSGDRYRCEAKHPGRPTISRPVVDKEIVTKFLARYGDADVIEGYIEDDDSGQGPTAVAELDAQIEETTRLMAAATDEAFDRLVEQVQQLRRQRTEAQERAGDTGMVFVYERAQHSVRQIFEQADDAECTALIASAMRLVIHPASRAEGRMEVRPDGTLHKPVLMRLHELRMLVFMDEDQLSSSDVGLPDEIVAGVRGARWVHRYDGE